MLVGGSLPAIFNGANEEAVELFRNQQLPFTAIVPMVAAVMAKAQVQPLTSIEVVTEATAWARRAVQERAATM